MATKSILLGLLLGLLGAGTAQAGETVLFVGNSYTYGAYSPVNFYRTASVTDLNGTGYGGVPALFKLFTTEAGKDYEVSLETGPGKGLDWHYTERLALIDRKWDHVVLQSFSTLDKDKPGDPTLLVKYTGLLAAVLTARNPSVDIRLAATWARPDLTYPASGFWAGKPIEAMSADVRAGYDLAAKKSPAIHEVMPVGQAFDRAIATGLAARNPYEGTGPGQIDLWTWDHYHASAYGYYLYALVAFGSITGLDPQTLGANERGAFELGFSRAQTAALEKIAHDQLAAEKPASKLAEPAEP